MVWVCLCVVFCFVVLYCVSMLVGVDAWLQKEVRTTRIELVTNRFLRIPRNDIIHYSRSLYHLSYARSRPPTLHTTLHIRATNATHTQNETPTLPHQNTPTNASIRYLQPEIHNNKRQQQHTTKATPPPHRSTSSHSHQHQQVL